MSNTNEKGLVALEDAKQNFALAMKEAQNLDIVNNVAGAFETAIVVNKLEAVLTDEVMQAVFMPLMNKKIGFLTDRDPSKPSKNNPHPVPYPISVVRTCIIDAAAVGLLPTGNQFNIISGSMYPAKAGFTALLAKMKHSMGLVYSFEFDAETTVKSADPSYVAIPCKVSYKTNREDLKGIFKYVAMVKSNGETSTTDQLRGKAERKCKKAFVEFFTGMDLGEGDPDSAVVDVPYTEVSSTTTGTQPQPSEGQQPAGSAQSAAAKAREILTRQRAAKLKEQPKEQHEAPSDTSNEPQQVGDIMGTMGLGAQQPVQQPAQQPSGMQANLEFDNSGSPDFSRMTDEQIDAYVNAHMGQEGGAQ